MVDDSRTFSADELTEVWEWLDSFDAQPLSGDGEQLARPPLTFQQARYVFGAKTYRIAKCSDGREVLGTLIAVAGYRSPLVAKTSLPALEAASAR